MIITFFSAAGKGRHIYLKVVVRIKSGKSEYAHLYNTTLF